MAQPLPILSDPQPERSIPLSEIPTELRNLRDEAERWRARWAQDTTEQRRQIRELTEQRDRAIAARDAARKTCDDLTTHCEGQGDRIARVESERDIYRDEAAALRVRVRDLSHEAESMRIERDDARQLNVRLSQRDEAHVQLIQSDRDRFSTEIRGLKLQLAEAKRAPERSEYEALRAQIAVLENSVRMMTKDAADYREQLSDLLAGDAGKNCEECGASGFVADEEMIGDPGAWHGHRIRSISVACEAEGCIDGRVQR